MNDFNVLYKRYLKERENLDVIENYGGFLLYKFENNHCFVNDCYVIPELRKKGVAREFIELVKNQCRQKDIKIIFCQSDENANGHDIARDSIQAVGFKEWAKNGAVTTYFMGVSNG